MKETESMDLLPYEMPGISCRVRGPEERAAEEVRPLSESSKSPDAEKTLQVPARELEELHTAIKVLLRQKARGESSVEQKFLANVNELILPFLARLRTTRLTGEQMSCVDIIEHNLRDLSSPLLSNLSSREAGLTQRELWVAKYVHDGMSIREIATLLQMSESVVKKHRASIRRKLGVGSRKSTLRSVLGALDSP